MIVLLIIFALVIVLFSFPAWTIFNKRVRWYRWDYGMPIYTIGVWFFLAALSFGKIATLSNLVVETFWVSVVSILSTWFRVIFPGKENKTSMISSLLAISAALIITILLRLLMPTLPE